MGLLEIRKRKNISRYRLSQVSGLSTTALKNIEEDINSPTLLTLQKLSDALQIPVGELAELLSDTKK